MQDNKGHITDPSQASESCQEESPSVFLHSSKLRNKLQRLARWRIDPSLIEFPQDAREFRGGFATVSQGLLASPSAAEGRANKSEQIADEYPSSETSNPKCDNPTQNPRGERPKKEEEVDGHTADGSIDDTKEKGRIDDRNGEQGPPAHDQTSMPKSVDQPDSSDLRDTQGDDGDGEFGKDEETKAGIADGKIDQTKDEGRKLSENTNHDQNSGHQNSKPKIVAVKKLKIEEDTDLERVIGLALRESEFLVELSHPNIVKIEGFVGDISDRKVWLIFPWEEHGNLRDFLASGEWEIPERISLINDVTLGLEYLHSREPPIYHGDLKSLNILVSLECHALITDFGSARHLENDRVGKRQKGMEDFDKLRPATDPSTVEECITLEALFSATASTLTLLGNSYTLRWAAPELLQEDQPCLRSDIWALGWIAYEVMTNTIPFHDVKKDAIVINRVIQGQLPSVTEDARMSLIRALCPLMVQCWNMNPDKRPTAEDCRKLISWMPMIVPAPTQGVNEEVSSTRYAQLLNQLGEMYKKQGDYTNAYDCFTKASNIYTISDDSSGKASNLRSLAELHFFRGEYTEAFSIYTEALQIYTEALQIYTEMGDQRERASAIFGLAEVRRFQQENDEAKTLYSECLKIYTDIGLKRSRATSLLGLASVHRDQGASSEAERLYLEALEISTDIGDRISAGRALWNLGEMHRIRGEYTEATKRFSEALEIRTEIGDRQGRAVALWGLAQVHMDRGNYNEAIKLFSEAIETFTDIGDKYWRAVALMSLAQSHRMQAHHSEAISCYEEASKALEATGDSWRAADALKNAEKMRRTLEEGVAGSAETTKVEADPLLNSD